MGGGEHGGGTVDRLSTMFFYVNIFLTVGIGENKRLGRGKRMDKSGMVVL